MHAEFLHRYDEEFLAGIAERRLRIAVDRHSGRALGLHERGWCARADGSVRWQRASGRATLLSHCVTRRPYSPDFPVPLVHGLVELAEGPRLICRVVDIEPAKVRDGMALKAAFDAKGLCFRKARASSARTAR
jgi:uncharacterized OB-fold protein